MTIGVNDFNPELTTHKMDCFWEKNDKKSLKSSIESGSAFQRERNIPKQKSCERVESHIRTCLHNAKVGVHH